jgi:phosphoribosyl 1,2-cyclic phosphodiesterase
MEVIPLQSGSSGNCVFVRVGQTRLLFDAGLSGRKTQQRLASFGHDIRDVDAVIISHDHSDHTSSLGSLNRQFGIPICLNRATYHVLARKRSTGDLSKIRHFQTGGTLDFDGVRVHTIGTPHDAADGVCFVIEAIESGRRFGLMTDLGDEFDQLHDWLPRLDALMIESNYDDQMLRDGPYAQGLKDRITGSGGHLSNEQTARLVRDYTGPHLQWVCLAHLSDENNTPELALAACHDAIGSQVRIVCADRHNTIEPLMIENAPSTTMHKPFNHSSHASIPFKNRRARAVMLFD